MDDTPPTPPSQPGYQPPMPPGPSSPISADERQMAMWCHLASLAGFIVPGGNLLGPLILWLTKRETMPFVDREGKESVNFQISIFIYALVSAVLIPVFCIGIFLLVAVGIFALVYAILAALEANKGNPYKYPLCIRFIT
jgi:uncharacterized Tic20 family protein